MIRFTRPCSPCSTTASIRLTAPAKKAAADPVFAFLLLGMGLRHFSMESARLLPIKEFMLAANAQDATALMRRIHRAHTIQDIRKHILEYFADHDELAAGFAASQVLCARPWQSFKDA